MRWLIRLWKFEVENPMSTDNKGCYIPANSYVYQQNHDDRNMLCKSGLIFRTSNIVWLAEQRHLVFITGGLHR